MQAFGGDCSCPSGTPVTLESKRMNPVGLILVAAGIFSICGAAFDWDWFINSRKARFFVATFGRAGARVFYGLLGILILIMGLLITFGILKNAT
jgi:Immunity protein 17